MSSSYKDTGNMSSTDFWNRDFKRKCPVTSQGHVLVVFYVLKCVLKFSKGLDQPLSTKVSETRWLDFKVKPIKVNVCIDLNWFEFGEIWKKQRQNMLSTMKTHCPWKGSTQNCTYCLNIEGIIIISELTEYLHQFYDLFFELLHHKCCKFIHKHSCFLFKQRSTS